MYVLDRHTPVPANLKLFLCDTFGSRTGREWERWKRAFGYYIEAAGIQNPATMESHLLHYGGEQLQDANIYMEAIARLDNFFMPKRNETFETDVFWGMKQKGEETMGQFHLRLSQQARYCGFGEQVKNNIKAQLINKCASTELREKLLQETQVIRRNIGQVRSS